MKAKKTILTTAVLSAFLALGSAAMGQATSGSPGHRKHTRTSGKKATHRHRRHRRHKHKH